jgi:hypothetical protein
LSERNSSSGNFDVHFLLGPDDGEIRRVGHVGERQVIPLGIADDILDRLQLGDIVPRFGRHLEAQVVGRKAALPVGRDRAPHRAFAPVVRGEREIPVAKFGVQLLQVVERAVGGGDHIAALIQPPVLLHAE